MQEQKPQNFAQPKNFEAPKTNKFSRISTGSYDLNTWLYGGYDKDIITTIYGPAGSGKTNLCILAAVSQAKKGNKTIFIDTEGGFSIDRIRQIITQNYEKALKNILLLKPTSFKEQKKAFYSLLKEIKNNQISLIIIDGMTMLYRLEINEARENKQEQKIKNINSELARQMRTLAEISRKQNIPILATNQVYSDFLTTEELKQGKEKQTHMVGGDIMKYWSKCIIELKNEKNRRRAILKKHRSMPEKQLSFIITNSGIRKKGWL